MKRAVSVILTAFLALPPSVFPKTDKAKSDSLKQFKTKLNKDQQILHALDRLTFGPRPGDVERVRKLGLKKWIDAQLHPASITENPELAAKLAPLEILRMSQSEVVSNYPPPQFIKAVANGRQIPPMDPALRATVERLAKRYKAKKGAGNDEIEPAKNLDEILTPDEVRTLRSGSPDAKRDLLASLDAEKLDETLLAMPAGMRQPLMQTATPAIRRKILAINAPQQAVGFDLNEGKIYRAVYSNRQLEELIADFWYNHFNVFLDKGADRFYVPSYERDAIRPFVLGNFRDLLSATAHSPAMLFYLDNWQSVANPAPGKGNKRSRGLNENYARELLELHTLGVDGGYTQKDIIEVARCFTGWTMKNPNAGGSFEYNDKVHDKGEKIVLGVTIPAGGGQDDAERVLDIVAHHPSTARFISRKLAARFVADNPPPALIDRMAATFTKSNGDIRQVMKAMLDSKEFWSAGAYQAKVKTPFEMIVSAVRALDANVESASPLAQRITDLGQPLYRKVEPTGYSSANAEWINSASLLARMNFALALAQNKINGVKVDPSRFSNDPAAVAKAVLFHGISPETRAAIENAFKDQKTQTPALLAGLVLGSPEFQRR